MLISDSTEDLLQIGQQLIRFDRERTVTAYSSIVLGGADECTCSPCRNYRPQRSIAFPETFVLLLDQIGIDPGKEAEICGCYPMPSGKRHYGGWFCFCGILLENSEGEVTRDGVTYYVRGPGTMPRPADVFEPHPLALEFAIEIPWVLLDENPDDLYGTVGKPNDPAGSKSRARRRLKRISRF